MSEYDFQNFLNHSNDDQILLMTEVCLTSEYLRHIVISQPEITLDKIKSDFDLPKNYEVAELIHRIKPIELSGILKKHIPRNVLITELSQIRSETQDCLIKYYMNKENKNIILKLKNVERVIESEQSIYSRILELNDQIELCDEAMGSSTKKTELSEYRIRLEKEIRDLVIEGIQEELGQVFNVVDNGELVARLPERINVHRVFKNTILFDFPVAKVRQEVIYNYTNLEEGNYFCLIWVGDFIGFPDAERFINLFHYNIKSISPLIGEMYVYDSVWNESDVCGVIFNQGEEVLEPRYSTVEIISEEYFKAYRINPIGEKDADGNKIIEEWEYYNREGRRVNKNSIETCIDNDKDPSDSADDHYNNLLKYYWSEKELEDYKTINQLKFSRWGLSDEEMKFALTKLKEKDSYKKHPNQKIFVAKDFYICFAEGKDKKQNGIGIDPDLNKHFILEQE